MRSIISFITILLAIVGCHEGYTSKDGSSLKQYLHPDQMKKLVQQPNPAVWIIDVRPQKAYNKWHIPTAQSFPSSTILDHLSELPKEQPLLFYCETGGRAQAVIRRLEKRGYTRMMNIGGYKKWKKIFQEQTSTH